jgi:exopolysaccharide biosynthesis predicted pyruvyltransferase EpsI
MSASCHELGAKLRETLDSAIPAGARVALLDYPNHENVGDSAIWLGEMTYLAERGAEVAYHCDLRSYDARHLRRLPDLDLLLLHGGGNLGDLWEPHQRFRERVLADFRDRPVVQLPQTIHFGDARKLERTKRAFARHPRFTLMVRDTRSLELARAQFDCSVVVCPDSAFALDSMTRPVSPRVPIVWLARTDHEAAAPAGAASAESDVERVDWVGRRSAPPLDLAARAGGELLAHLVGRLASPPRPALDLLWADWDRLARHRVAAGQRMLSRGAVVVTDRLHAHVFCLLLGIPHVVLDNSYGKLSSYAQTWDTLGGDARWADSPAEALALARGIGG